MDKDDVRPAGLPINEAPAGLRHSVGIPDASEIRPLEISKDWQWIDIEDPAEALGSFKERIRREMATCQKCEKEARKNAADELEQADIHAERSRELWNLLNALIRMPIAFPAQVIEAGTGETEGLDPKDESAVHAPKPSGILTENALNGAG